MRKNERTKKLLSGLLALAMVVQNFPMVAFAAPEDNLCPHHPEHTAECHYEEGVHECHYVCSECEEGEAPPAEEVVPQPEPAPEHTHVYDGAAQYGEKDDAVHTVTRACTSCEEQPTQTVEEAHTYAEGFCVCGKAEPVHTHAYVDGFCECGEAEPVHTHVYVEGICECGAACEHIYAEGVCTVCSMAEPVQEPQVLTITAWSWVDDYEIIDPDYMDAVIPGVGAENPIDWETLVEFLPAYITAQVNGEEVELPVTWECETFPEAATGGKYTVKAILPAGYVLGEGVTALELDVDLGAVEQYAITPTKPANGDGTESNPYQITSADELYWFAEHVNAGNASACAKLMNDITVNENVLVNGALNSDTGEFVAWIPIGVRIESSTKAFRGTFDGGNHTISGLYVSATSGYQGLIGFMESGTVKNVTVANSYFSGTTNIGAVVGCYGTEGVSTVTNCHNVGSVVIGSDYYVGGVVGGQYAPATSHAQIVLSNCSNSGSVTGAKHYVGGIIGYAEYFSEGTAISNCTNTGTVTNTSTSRAQGTGGIAGYFGGSSAVKVEIVGCPNSGTIQITEGGKQDYMGGIIGQNSYGHISDCNNAGTISGYQYAGGIVGTNSGTVTNCQNTGAVISTYAGIGGIAGRNSGTVTTCTNNGSVQGGRHIGGIVGSGAGVSGCTNTGDVTSNTYGVGGVIGYIGAAGTVTGCHNEGTVKGTNYIGGLVGHHDTGKVTYTECSNKGAVEGSAQNVGGLFGRISSGSTASECYNEGDVSCTGTYSKQDNYGVGGLAGSTFNAVKFEDCYNTGSVNGGSNPYVGGLVGFFHYASGSTENYIKRSHNTGSVTGGIYTGGLFGTYESNGVSEECYNTGSVSGNNYVGGLVGYRDYTGSSEKVIKNCYNTGSVSGTTNVGGLFGYSFYNNCLETSYNVGTVSGTSNFGGVIGNNKPVINCYYLDTCVTNGNSRTGAKALTAQQMTDDANWQTNFAGFDTTTPVWSKQNNEGTKKYLPKLDSYSPTLHVHSWTYSTDGNTITATCNVDGCSSPNGGTVTISAPTDLSYSNSSKDAACTYVDWLPDEPTIVYNEVDRINVTGEVITASITIGEATASVSYQITPREITASMVTTPSATYDGSEKTVTVTVKDNSTTLTAGTDYEVTGTTSATEPSTGNGYAVTITGKGNYTGEVTRYWKINKISLSPTIDIEGWTYLDDPKEPSVTENPENGEVTYTYYVTYSGRTPTKTGTANGAETEGGVPKYAGTYYVGAVIAETDHYNKKTITPTANTEFVISPKEVTEPTFEGLQATYPYDNGNEIKPTFTLKDDLGNVIPESEYTVAYSNNTAVGTASITVTDIEGGNYTVNGSATFQIVSHVHEWSFTASGYTITATCEGTVGTCPVENNTVTIQLVAPENLTYDGAVKTVTVTQSPADFFDDVPAVIEGAWINAGQHTASLTYGEKTATLTFTIEKATPTIAWDSTTASVNYTGSAAAITAPTVTLVNGETYNGTISYSYNGTSSGNGLPINAGTYKITASIAAQNNYTETTSTNTLTLTINKVAASVTTAPEPVSNLTYNGGEQTLITAGTASGGTMQYSMDNAIWSGDIPVGKDVGNYTVYYKVIGDSNHNDTASQSVTVTITCNHENVTYPADRITDTQHMLVCPCGYAVTEDHTTTAEATCISKAVCEHCGEYGTINPNAHSYGELIPAKAAVHTKDTLEPGVDAHYFCGLCGTYFTEDKVETTLEALTGETPEHSYTGKITTDPTCSEKGVETFTCLCGDSYTEDVAIDKNAHAWGETAYDWTADGKACTASRTCLHNSDHVETAKATITSKVKSEPGCTSLGETTYTAAFTAGWAESQTKDVYDIPVKGHVMKETTARVEPDCENEGREAVFTCANGCGHTEGGKVIDALGHDYKSVVTAPDCENGGFTTYTCSVCGDSYVDDEVDALGHKPETIKGYAATCTKPGLTDGSKCGLCGETLTAQKEIPATGEHTYDQEKVDEKYLVSEATCTEQAIYYKSCICGEKGTETFKHGDLKPHKYTDVDPNGYYHDAVVWADQNGITNGTCDGTTFEPDAAGTRAHMITFLWRAAGCPAPKSSEMPFKDVENGEFYTTAVLWAAENGITIGYGVSDIFAPDIICTRGQIITMLNRYLGGKATSTENPFVDVAEDTFYYDAVLWAAENGITNGYGDTDTFAPNITCTRAQIVTFLYRALHQHR